jgi:xanthine dehydrogenase molybdenum-binding subunit
MATRIGSKARGVGVASVRILVVRSASTGLLILKPDGRLTVQSGIGNLGTESTFDVHRVAAELVGIPWDKVDIVWGKRPRICQHLQPELAVPRRTL